MYCSKCGHHNDVQAAYCRGCGNALHTALGGVLGSSPYQPMSLGTPMRAAGYAGFWRRALALLIDTVLATLLSVLIALPLGFVFGVAMAARGAGDEVAIFGELLGNLLGMLVSWLYFTLCEASGWQATPGKRLLGLRVTDLDGRRIGFGRANGRYWAKILSALILLIGYLMAGFTARKQALHDMLAGTLVVRV